MHYEKEVSWTLLRLKFPNRTIRAIKAKASSLGLSREHLSSQNYAHAYCPIHGRIGYTDIQWTKSKSGKNVRPRCPYRGCNRQVRLISMNKLSIREKNRRRE